MNRYGLHLLTDSAMNIKYLHLCMQGSYINYAECSTLCWNQFPLGKKKLL